VEESLVEKLFSAPGSVFIQTTLVKSLVNLL